MQIIHKTENGTIVQGDNIEVMEKVKENTVDSCISDFPYNLSFMGKKWDTSENFYDWCYKRASGLHRIMKPGGYVCIFGHPKTNHRMKSAFEDVGFKIVEEIDWVYLTGLPKNQDIGKLFDKKAGKKRPLSNRQRPIGGRRGVYEGQGGNWGETENIPQTEESKIWDGWKTAGLKPAHEPITIFQKPLEGTYIQNIKKYGCGGMNIDACRVPINPEIDDPRLGGKGDWSTKKAAENIYEGGYAGERVSSSELGRFPANIIFNSSMGEILDEQSGFLKSGSVNPDGYKGEYTANVYGKYANNQIDPKTVYADSGGASRYFLKINAEDFVPFLYCPKPTKKEKGKGNTHVTVKPKELIKWLIKLVTPVGGRTIDITAGSGTHGLSCEELNRDENYNLHWLNIEMLNTEKEPYCEIAKNRIRNVI